MAEFEISINSIKIQIPYLQMMEGNLNHIHTQLLEVKKEISLKSEYSSAINHSLRAVGKEVEYFRGQLKLLGNRLSELISLYDKTERTIATQEHIIEEITKEEYPELSSADIEEIKKYLRDHPKADHQSSDEYLEVIKQGLLEIPGITVSGVQILLEKLADIYGKQAHWLTKEAGKALSYTDDVVQYIDDVAMAANVANEGRRVSNIAGLVSGFGIALDFGLQIASGENVVDATIKTAAHVAINVGVAFMFGNPVGLAAVGVAAVGYAGGKLFDYVYDNPDVILDNATTFVENVGDTITGFFAGAAAVFS